MLKEMHTKGVAEKEAEAAAFAEYQTFCKDTAWDKTTSIKTGAAAIEQLTADIGKATADIHEAAKAIATLNEDITAWKEAVTVQTRERNEAHDVFATVHKDYTESIDAVQRALATLKAGPGQSAASLLQVKISSLTQQGATEVQEGPHGLLAKSTHECSSAGCRDARTTAGQASRLFIQLRHCHPDG